MLLRKKYQKYQINSRKIKKINDEGENTGASAILDCLGLELCGEHLGVLIGPWFWVFIQVPSCKPFPLFLHFTNSVLILPRSLYIHVPLLLDNDNIAFDYMVMC